MKLLPPLAVFVLVWCSTSGRLEAQAVQEKDRDLDILEARLQEQRAASVCMRLTLYTDELLKLQAQYTAAEDTASAAAVNAELDAVGAALKRLTAIARGTHDPPMPGEFPESEKTGASAPAISAKRIDRVIAQFTQPGEVHDDPARGTGTAPARPRVLKFDKATLNRDYAGDGGSKYWSRPSSYVGSPGTELEFAL